MNGSGFIGDFKDWAADPFSQDMSAYHWFLLIGFFIVCAFLWSYILSHLVDALKG